MAAATMRAARYHGKEDIRIEQIVRPTCGPGQIKIRPAYVGICGTDLHEFLSGPNFSPISPHPVTGEKIPIGLGHEFSGTILEIGASADPKTSSSSSSADQEEGSKLKVGQKVAVQPSIFCGGCGACRNGVENACSKGGFVGLSGGGGGLSEEVVVPARAVLALPEDIGLDVGALVEPLAVAWHAVSASPLSTLDPTRTSVLILGGGPIGLAVLQVLLAHDVANVIVSEVAAQRQVFAKRFGAHHVLDPRVVDLVVESKKLCGDDGPDVVFDCAGVPASLETACKSIKSRGTVVNVAIWEKEVPFNPNWLVFREGRYVAVLGYQRKDFEAVIDALRDGRLKPQGMITGKIKMGEVVGKGIWALVKEKDQHVKILVDVNSE